jgi:3-methylcrotonyl-CoA carboxylase alpha subunit
MIAALADYAILGCATGIPFLLDVLEHPAFIAGETHTHFIPDHFPAWNGRQRHLLFAAIAAAIDAARPPHAGSERGTTSPSISPWSTLGQWRLGQG